MTREVVEHTCSSQKIFGVCTNRPYVGRDETTDPRTLLRVDFQKKFRCLRPSATRACDHTLICVGQDVVAMSCLELAHRNGHWVILNNIHLMPSWLIELEKKLDEFALEGSHEKFRLYLSSDPSNAIPIGVLSRCIKLTNEPPAGLKANLKRAFANFSREYVEEVSYQGWGHPVEKLA